MAMIAETAKWSQSTAGVTARLQVGGPVNVGLCRCEWMWAGRVAVIEQFGSWWSFLSVCDDNDKLAVTRVNSNYYWIKSLIYCAVVGLVLSKHFLSHIYVTYSYNISESTEMFFSFAAVFQFSV